jgi:AcrR family transcriptional regulator
MFSDANESRQAVLESAIEAFASKGYAGTSVQDILSVTGLSKPTLYYYFQSKAGLFQAILNFAYDESFRLVRERSQEAGTSRDKLVEIAVALFEFTQKHRDLMRLVLATAFAAPGELPTDAIHPEKRLRFFGLVRDTVAAGQSSGELDQRFNPDELAHGVLGAITHQVRTSLIRPEAPLDRKRAQGIVTLFLEGARNRKRSPQ